MAEELRWIVPPQMARVHCSISKGIQETERTVEFDTKRDRVTAIVPSNLVRESDSTLVVTLVAKVNGSSYLAQLPVVPLNGDQRFEIEAAKLDQAR